MKKIFLMVAGLLALAEVVDGQEFPAEEVWSVNLENRAVLLGEPWTEDNGDISCFLRDGDHLAIVRAGELIWNGPLPEGDGITAGTYADFGLEDGPRLLVAVVWDSIGQIVEYYGDDFESQIVHSPPFLRLEGEGDEMDGSSTDSRAVKVILPLRNNQPDTSRTVLLSVWTSYHYWDSFWPESSSSSSGGIVPYSLANDEGHQGFAGGFCLDYQVLDRVGEGLPTYLFGCNILGERHSSRGNNEDTYTGVGFVYAVNDRLEIISQLSTGGYQGNYFRLFPDRGGGNHKIVGVGCRNNEQGPGGYPNVYWSNWPAERPDISVDSMWYGRVVDYESPEDRRRFALLPRNNQILIISVDGNGIAGLLDFSEEWQDLIDMRSVISERGVRDEVIALFNDRISLYRVGSLYVPPAFSLIPQLLSLSAFPNPFNSSTTISYSLPTPGRYAIDVIDIHGRLVTSLDGGWKEAGSYRASWNPAMSAASGSYMLVLRNDIELRTQSVTLIK